MPADIENQPESQPMLGPTRRDQDTGPGTAGQLSSNATTNRQADSHDEHIRMYLAQGLAMSTLTLTLGGIHKDSSGKLWSIYLTEADKHDEEMTEHWRGEADSILVFVRVHILPMFYLPSNSIVKTGLFAGLVGTFLNLSYSNLFPTTSETTNALLAQISQQLANVSSGVPDAAQILLDNDKNFTPSNATICVNILWFLSLIFSMASAVNATLFQQWARRYLDITKRRVAPHKRARTRSYMFNGIKTFHLSRVVRIMPVLLHISIALFFSGLVIFVSNLNFLIGVVVLVFVSMFALAYLVLTVLPHVYFNCPYSTPISEISWRTSHRLTLLILQVIQALDRIFISLPFSRRQSMEGQRRWATRKDAIRERQNWVKHGPRGGIMLNAENPSPKVDSNALSWTLTALDDDREFEDFVARVPGFFESKSVQDARSVMLSLMEVQSQSSQFDPILGSCIYDLLKTCVPGTSPLREESRKNRLRICLRSLWYFARGYIQSGKETPLPSYVRKFFADPEMTRRIQSEEDLAARLIGRSFSALVVKKLVEDIRAAPAPSLFSSDGSLSCLAAILGVKSKDVGNLLGKPGAIGLANIISLTSSEMGTLTTQTVPSEVLDLFEETLKLLEEDLCDSADAELPALIAKLYPDAQQADAQQEQAPKWLLDLLRKMKRILEGSSADESDESTLASQGGCRSL